jgi:hypothetical protein
MDSSASHDFISLTRNIAKFIGRTEKATFHLLETGKIPGAKKFAGAWTLHVPTFRSAFLGEQQAAA